MQTEIYKPTIDFSLHRLIAVKISLEDFIHSTKSFGSAIIYIKPNIVETLKAEFKLKTDFDLIFVEMKNDLSPNSKELNKYFVQPT